MNETTALLLLPRLRVQNANAIPGPLSWGFPAPTAFLGFTDALKRRLHSQIDLDLGGCGIICHGFEPQVARPAGRFQQVFRLTRNPYYAGWKRGFTEDKPAALVEEGRVHIDVSLIIEVRTELHEDDQQDLLDLLPDVLGSMRLAGGSLLPAVGPARRQQPRWYDWYETTQDNLETFRRLRHQLLPGFALIERTDLLATRLTELQAEQTDANALDALLDLCRLNIDPIDPDPRNPERTQWQVRARSGWFVPIPLGYAALSPLHAAGSVKGARDMETPFRFCESLYGLGQWMSPHRFTDCDQLLWHRATDATNGIYRCVNHYASPPTATQDSIVDQGD